MDTQNLGKSTDSLNRLSQVVEELIKVVRLKKTTPQQHKPKWRF